MVIDIAPRRKRTYGIRMATLAHRIDEMNSNVEELGILVGTLIRNRSYPDSQRENIATAYAGVRSTMESLNNYMRQAR